ncbi:helix-turn-helix domain-containing protein [Streptomyces sp. NPDC092296]|uniref:AraC-like ligand-binding domain-containing protein n=1 Tax=Streptomyces sp. NPDC092296 TaxID=3366012 RepID=UPI0037F10F6F
MLSETVFRSEDFAVGDRFDAWQECTSRMHAPLELSRDHTGDFRADARLIRLGAVSVWPAAFEQHVWRRTPKLIRQSDPELYHLSLVLRGEARVSWGTRNVTHRAYDFHTNDSARPWEIRTSDGLIKSVGIEVPKALLPLPRHQVDRVIGQRMSGREGIGSLLAQFVTRLVADTDSYQPADAPRIGTVLSDLVTALFAQILDADASLPPETHSRALTLRIKAFIRRHLHDPELTPGAIATAHHISRSYLHRLFQAESETVAAYIRRLRLEAARRDLTDPAWRTAPIHAIAARWGFCRPADFSRAFRIAYGISPKDHRHQAFQAQPG